MDCPQWLSLRATLLSGKDIEVSLDAGSSVDELRQVLVSELNCLPKALSLVWQEQVLCSPTDRADYLMTPLASLGITSGSRIQVCVLAPRPTVPNIRSFKISLRPRSDGSKLSYIDIDCNLDVNFEKCYDNSMTEIVSFDTRDGIKHGCTRYHGDFNKFRKRIDTEDLETFIQRHIEEMTPVVGDAPRFWHTAGSVQIQPDQKTELQSEGGGFDCDRPGPANLKTGEWIAPSEDCSEFNVQKRLTNGFEDEEFLLDIIRILVDSNGNLLRVAAQDGMHLVDLDFLVI